MRTPAAPGTRWARLLTVVLATALALGVTAGAPAADPVNQVDPTDDALSWGYNSNGQLGNDSTTNSRTPVPVELDGTALTQVAGGQRFSLGLTEDGRVLAWGDNGSGQLGNGSNSSSNTPVEVALPPDTTITQLAAGANHTLALTDDGRVLAWGNNRYGQLGNGSDGGRSNTPVAVTLPPDTTITQLAAGADRSLALTDDGRVLAWGHNANGEGGNDSNTPVEVAMPPNTTVTQVASGGDHSLALTDDGRVLAWGSNYYGQLGNGTNVGSNTPVDVRTDATITQLAAGPNHNLALTNDGRVLAWGDNWNGQLGNGSSNSSSNTPVEASIPQYTTVTQVAAGGEHSLALAEPYTSTAVTADPSETTLGESVTLTATVGCTTTPTGTVTFFDGESEIGTADLNADGVATLTTGQLSTGQRQITARYEGDAACPPSTSDPVTVTVNAPPEPPTTSPEPTDPPTTSPEPTEPPTTAPGTSETTPAAPGANGTPPPGNLATTGFSAGALTVGAALLVALGIALTAWARRRSTDAS